MIPSNFRIEILSIRALLCAIGSKELNKKGIIEKNFYERGAYESVDEESLSLVMSLKTTKKRIHAFKG